MSKLPSSVTQEKPKRPHELATNCDVKRNLIRDIQFINGELKRQNRFAEFQALQKPALVKSVAFALIDWLVIFASWYIVAFIDVRFAWLAIPIIGNRQRALGNIFHDAGHKVLDSISWRNNLISDLLLACPLFNLTSYYWLVHKCHHGCLSSMESDPDLIHQERYYGNKWYAILSENVFSVQSWKGSILGYLPHVSFVDGLKVLAWWAVFISILFGVFGGNATLIFIALWMISKATVFHFITIFREISDHVGLQPGSLIKFTRNNPTHSLLRFVFHPHSNGYHLTHHLAYRIPFFNLRRAHTMLMSIEAYQQAHHCDGYFFGRYTVIQSWTGNRPSTESAI